MSSSPTTPDPNEPTRAKLLDLSLTQLVAGSMAAATAAALGSRLGVVGTIAGAAVGSVVSAIAASLYVTSMTRAREALLTARRLGESPPAGRPRLADRWRPLDTVSARRLLATSGSVFAVAAAFLLGLQLASGAPVTGTDIGTRQPRVVEVPAGQALDPEQADRTADAAGAAAPTGSPTAPPAAVDPTPGATGTPGDTPTTGAPTPAPTDPAATPPVDPDPTATTGPTSPTTEPATPVDPAAPSAPPTTTAPAG